MNNTYIIDKHFNRIWTGTTHLYMNNTGERSDKSIIYKGYLKCKLAHGLGFSIIIPDIIFIEHENRLYWIQPLHFLPNLLGKFEDKIIGYLWVDISCSQTLQIQFSNHDYVRKFLDGSELFACEISGPENLHEYTTGKGYWKDSNIPIITLFHHTTLQSKENILKDKNFRLSQWNIQGNKKLKNIGYVYFTCLPEIICDQDLIVIAMATDGKKYLIRDGVEVPIFLLSEHMDIYKNDILELKVYRESTTNRKETIQLNINPSFLTPQHLIKHTDEKGKKWYEIITPFIYRIGIEVGGLWSFSADSYEGSNANLKQLDYVIIGDGTTVDGLKAPFNEENTNLIAKIQKSGASKNLLNFWFKHGNQELFSNLEVEYPKFEHLIQDSKS